jgi:serine/threonine-protein kinase
MTPERWHQVKQVFQSVIECPPDERDAFLARACAGDHELRSEVESLISSHDQAGDSIEAMAVEAATEMIAEDQASTNIGKQIGHYQVLGHIGRGGMGEVFLAQDTRLGRKVALKLLRSEYTRDEDRLRRFQQEARAASALNHPNILTIHDVGEADSQYFIATEYVEGETLRQHIGRSRMSLGQALDVAAQVAGALAAAHQAGIIHRDIKPENIMLRNDGYIKVLDFGLAKLAEPKAAESAAPTLPRVDTEPGMIMGTVNYMSPEQARGLATDAGTDIWSLGVVIYEMAAGCRPFEGETASDVIASILQKEPVPLAHYSPEVPAELERIVEKTLRKGKEERYQDVKDLLTDLKSLAAETPQVLPVVPEGKSRRALQPTREKSPSAGNWKRRTIAASLTILALGLGLLAWRLTVRSPRPSAGPARIESVAVLPLENLSGDPEQEYFADGMTDALITDLAKIHALRVISRTSVMLYKGKHEPAPQIARELNVDAIVAGTVMRSGDRVRITAQLIEGPKDQNIWADAYERDLRDILALQGDVARAIAGQISVTLTLPEQTRLSNARPVDPAAHQAYLRGLFELHGMTAEPNETLKSQSINKAIGYFQEALAHDPNNALAFAGLADAYSSLSTFYRAPLEVMPRAKSAATKAIELDDTLAETHASLGYIALTFDWDWARAEHEFRRALELDPSSSRAHAGYAQYLLFVGGRSNESMQELQQAYALDPLLPQPHGDMAWFLFLARRYAESIDAAHGVGHDDHIVALCNAELGQSEQALAAADRAVGSTQSPVVRSQVAAAYALAGRKDKARAMLDEVKAQARGRYVCGFNVACLYSALGDKEQAFAWLEEAYSQRSD